MSKFKTIVFGGSGFLGSHIADALSNSGHEVTIYDLIESPFLRDDQKMIIGSLQIKNSCKSNFRKRFFVSFCRRS